MMNDTELEKYKAEMMKMYQRRTAVPASVYVSDNDIAAQGAQSVPEQEPTPQPIKEPEPIKVPEQEPMRVPEQEPMKEPEPMTEPERMETIPEEMTMDEKYPEPDISSLADTMPENASRETVPTELLGDSQGFILVNVRTGDDSLPVENATVTISAVSDGRRFYLGSDVTDESGRTKRFSVPVPNAESSLTPGSKVRPYGLFDISVSSRGFFNVRSVDVPVFSGITSLQNFSMIPVPQFMRPDEETIVNYNQEPML